MKRAETHARSEPPRGGENRIWSVAACQPGRDRIAAINLENQRIRHFLPYRKKSVRVANRFHTRLAPLFPGYIFVALEDQIRQWRAVNGTIGIKYLIAAHDRPALLPAGFVEQLIEFADGEGLVSRQPNLQPGDRVEITQGPFANRVGEILSLDEKGRVAVLLELLSTSIPVRTRVEDILPA